MSLVEKFKNDMEQDIAKVKAKYDSEVRILEAKIGEIETKKDQEIQSIIEKNKREIASFMQYINSISDETFQRENLPELSDAQTKQVKSASVFR